MTRIVSKANRKVPAQIYIISCSVGIHKDQHIFSTTFNYFATILHLIHKHILDLAYKFKNNVTWLRIIS